MGRRLWHCVHLRGPSTASLAVKPQATSLRMTAFYLSICLSPMSRYTLIELLEVHACVEAGDLVGVAVEGLGGDGPGKGARVDAALVGLGPAGVVDLG